MIYFPDGSTRGYPFPHFAWTAAASRSAQPIDSDATPIAWPRPADAPIPPVPAVGFDALPNVANTGATPAPPA